MSWKAKIGFGVVFGLFGASVVAVAITIARAIEQVWPLFIAILEKAAS